MKNQSDHAIVSRHSSDELAKMETQNLRAELAMCLKLTAADFTYMASIFRELSRRGENLDDLRQGLGTYLALIADGNLLPEIVVQFSGRHSLLQAIAALPISDQRQIADDGTVELVGANGEANRIPVTALTTRNIRQVFADHRLRSRNEQIVLMENGGIDRPAKKARKRRVWADPRTKLMHIANARIPIGQIMSAVAEAAGRQGDIIGDVNGPSVGARLTEEERERLRAACKAMRLDEPEFVRRAILTWLI